MRSVRFCLPIFVLVAFSGWSQQTPGSQTPSVAPQDLKAVSVLSQVLASSGGAAAIGGISDYTATGSVTYHWNPEEQGMITIQGLGLGQFRIDAALPSGTYSESIQNGQTSKKGPDGTIQQYPPPYPVPSSDAFVYQPAMFPAGLVLPQMQLALVLGRPRYSISYKGIVQVDGNSVHDIAVERISPSQTQLDVMAEYHAIEFFVDPNAFQIVMTQDSVPNHVLRQVRYSNYKSMNGVSVPSTINERMGGQSTRDIEINQISFNSGLSDSAFVLQ